MDPSYPKQSDGCVCRDPLLTASSFMFANARLKLVPKYFGGVCDPCAMARDWRNASEAAATRRIMTRVPRACRPAHHTDHRCALCVEPEHGRTGVAGTCAASVLL